MAGLSAETRDLGRVARGMAGWWAHVHPDDSDVELSAFTSNPNSGYSSESLLFDARVTRYGRLTCEELVLRMPPAGGGLFPEYDMQRQSATQELLAANGIPTASPAKFEANDEWIGTPFMVMPRLQGRIPGDYTYPRKGWLFDAPPSQQRAHVVAFVDALSRLANIDATTDSSRFLHRRDGPGLKPEIEWWADYLAWACDGQRHAVMSDAYAWARETAPPEVDPPSVLWGDARFANTVYSDDGSVVGMLDWEQAAIGPAELDLGFWLASRRQACEAVGVSTDPELPGFPRRADVLAQYERGIGRPIRALAWHEAFAMVRMGTCIVSTQALLRRAGNLDHPFLHASPLPAWTLEVVAGGQHGHGDC